jgi:anthranilate synthase/aminodeoxychorismate synthase-like glutamine amidotransferase
MKTVVIDAFDSFVFIIDQYLRALDLDPVVIRSGEDNAERIRHEDPDLLVLGPGPGHPTPSGHVELVHEFAGSLPILGVCLGHQAIAAAYGAQVVTAEHIMHGKTSTIDHDGGGVFAGTPQGQTVTRYHSLIVEEASLPAELEVSARSRDDGYIMGLRHRELPIEAVQFHPESVTTEGGMAFFSAFRDAHVGRGGSSR